jgi:hypothetical protein
VIQQTLGAPVVCIVSVVVCYRTVHPEYVAIQSGFSRQSINALGTFTWFAAGLFNRNLSRLLAMVTSLFRATQHFLTAIQFDRTGTTRIGKYVLNHSFMLPGIVTTVVIGCCRLVSCKNLFCDFYSLENLSS